MVHFRSPQVDARGHIPYLAPSLSLAPHVKQSLKRDGVVILVTNIETFLSPFLSHRRHGVFVLKRKERSISLPP